MAIGNTFITLWKEHFTLISTSLFSLILIVVEQILEEDFKCPKERKWRFLYGLCYFVIPCVILILLALIFLPAYRLPSGRANESCSCTKWDCCTYNLQRCRCCGIPLKILLPALLWIVILLLDGRYLDCLVKQFRENITAENLQQPTNVHHISQIAGLSLTFIVVLSGCIRRRCRSCCRKCCEREITLDSHERQQLLEKIHAYVLNKKEEAIWLLVKNRLKYEYLVDPETIVMHTESRELSALIDCVLNISREGSDDEERVELDSHSSREITSSSFQETTSD